MEGAVSGSINIDPNRGVRSADQIGGGVNLELITRIALLENAVSSLEQRVAQAERHATGENYGLVKLSNSKSVTTNDGLALPASENNASISGTLANRIESVGGTVSRAYLLSGGQSIPANADLNTYTGIGNYHCHDSANVQSLSNCPVQVPFVMKVEYSLGFAWPCQVIRAYDGGSMYYRFTPYEQNWFPWYVIESKRV